MSTKLETLVVLVLPITCMLFLSVSVVCLYVSRSPDVKWNEYNSDEIYPGTGFYAYYYNTLWGSMDANQYEGKANSGNFLRILNTRIDDSWKVDTQCGVTKALGLTSGSLFLLIIALSIHLVTEQKLFVIISNILSAILGLTGGGICLQTISDYKDNLVKGILPRALDPNLGGFYMPELEVMKLGYMLVNYGGIIILTVCTLIIVQCILYIQCAEGKWVWKENTVVASKANDP